MGRKSKTVPITTQWLRAHGIEGSETTVRDVAYHANQALTGKIVETLIVELDDDLYGEFEHSVGRQSNLNQQLAWLERLAPEYQQIAGRVAAEFKQDIIRSEFPITYILGQAVS